MFPYFIQSHNVSVPHILTVEPISAGSSSVIFSVVFKYKALEKLWPFVLYTPFFLLNLITNKMANTITTQPISPIIIPMTCPVVSDVEVPLPEMTINKFWLKHVYGFGIIHVLWTLSNSTHQVTRENVSDCTGCWNTQVLFQLTEILWNHKFLLDVTGCQKTQVSICTSYTVFRRVLDK